MADVKILSPIILKWEGGYQCFKEDKGNYNSKGELVGTNKGITATTYETVFCKIPTVEDIKAITIDDFTLVLKRFYWNKWQADLIHNQSIANILVDWLWASGKWGIIRPQRLLGLNTDGVVGINTIKAVNQFSQKSFFSMIQTDRIRFVDEIIAKNPSQKKFEKGWKNRINYFQYSEQ